MKEENKLSAYVVGFSVHLERLGYGKSSIKMLPRCLKEFLVCQKDTQLENITSADIMHYHHYLQERPHKYRAGGLSESYISHHIFSLKLFFQWQLNTGSLSECPISSLEFKSPVSKTREILTQEEIQLVFASAETLKEKAILSIFYGCGLRRKEGEKLNLKDLHFRSNILYVREGKGKKRRAVPLHPKVRDDIKNYVYKERKSQENEEAVITNKLGLRMSGNSYNEILKSLLNRTGIKKIITLHCLRHSIATHLLENGLSVEYVRDFLGHKHLESTQIYTRINKQQIYSLNEKQVK